MLNLDVNILTSSTGCLHYVKPSTFVNVYVTVETFQIYEGVGSAYTLLESYWWLKNISRWGI